MSAKDGGVKLVACVCLVFPTWRINYSEALPVLASETPGLVGFLSFLVRGGGGADFLGSGREAALSALSPGAAGAWALGHHLVAWHGGATGLGPDLR